MPVPATAPSPANRPSSAMMGEVPSFEGGFHTAALDGDHRRPGTGNSEQEDADDCDDRADRRDISNRGSRSILGLEEPADDAVVFDRDRIVALCSRPRPGRRSLSLGFGRRTRLWFGADRDGWADRGSCRRRRDRPLTTGFSNPVSTFRQASDCFHVQTAEAADSTKMAGTAGVRERTGARAEPEPAPSLSHRSENRRGNRGFAILLPSLANAGYVPLEAAARLVSELTSRGYNAEREAVTRLAAARDPNAALERVLEDVPDDALVVRADHVESVLSRTTPPVRLEPTAPTLAIPSNRVPRASGEKRRGRNATRTDASSTDSTPPFQLEPNVPREVILPIDLQLKRRSSPNEPSRRSCDPFARDHRGYDG